jgi:hypothetical protein
MGKRLILQATAKFEAVSWLHFWVEAYQQVIGEVFEPEARALAKQFIDVE